MLLRTSFQRTVQATPAVLCAVFRRHVHATPRPDFAFHGTVTERGFEARRNADYWRDRFLWWNSPRIKGKFLPSDNGTRVNVGFGPTLLLIQSIICWGVALSAVSASLSYRAIFPAIPAGLIFGVAGLFVMCVHANLVRMERWAIESMLDEAEQVALSQISAAPQSLSDHPEGLS